MKEINAKIDEFIQTLSLYGEKLENRNGSHAIVPLIAVSTYTQGLINKGALQLLSNLIFNNHQHEEAEDNQGVIHKLKELTADFIRKLYLACDWVDSSEESRCDDVSELLKVIIKGLENIIAAVKKDDTIILKLVKNKILNSLHEMMFFFYTLLELRKFNLQQHPLMNLKKSVLNLKAELPGDDSPFEFSEKNLRQLIQDVRDIVQKNQPLCYFEFYNDQSIAINLIDSHDLIAQLKMLCYSLFKRKVETGALESDALKIEPGALLALEIDKLELHYSQQLLLANKTIQFNVIWQPNMLKRLHCIHDNLELGIQQHCNSFFNTLNNSIVLDTANFLKQSTSRLIGLMEMLQKIPFDRVNLALYGMIGQNLVFNEIKTLKEVLIFAYEQVLSKKHPLKGMFEATFCSTKKLDKDTQVEEQVKCAIERIFALPQQFSIEEDKASNKLLP